MSTPARYWIVLFAFSALLCACAARGGSPLPFVPQAPVVTGVNESTVVYPDVQKCATDKAQPGWVFRGVCRYASKLAAGKSIAMPVYSGFTVTYKIPKNNAPASRRIIFAVANRTNVAARKGRHRLGQFPTDGPAFLYFKTENPGTAIHFRKHTRAVFEVAYAGSTTLTAPCAIDRLQKISGTWTWTAVPAAARIAGTTLTISISRRHYADIPHGPAYYAVTCSEAPTPTPSPKPTKKPTPKPSHSPTPSPSSTPSYCANYSIPAANTVPVDIADNSGLGATLILYVWNGTSWMTNAGAFGATSANPIPFACFQHSKSRHFALPPTIRAGRLYIAYSASTSTTVVPNPLANMPPGGPAPTYGNAYYSIPWDVIELGTTSGAIVDLTAVTNLGLPLEMGQAPPGQSPFSKRIDESRRPAHTRTGRAIPAPCATSGAGVVGVTSCNYANIYTAMSSVSQYQNLVATGNFNGKIIDLRIINPAKAQGGWNFGSDWFYNPAYLGAYPSVCSGVPTPLANGYLSCVLAAYQTTSRLYATAGSGVAKVTNANYCVSSDGSANFGFTSVGTSTSCAGITYTSPNTKPMPIALFEYGTPPQPKDGRGCDAGFLFGMPPNSSWINTGPGKKPSKHPNVFLNADAFAVWKGIAIDLNRGAALSTGAHPAGGWAQNFASPAAFSNYYNDPLYNDFAYIVHYYYDHNQSYALSYDEPGGQASAFAYVTGNAIDIRVNAVPTAAAVSPVATPVPFPLPSPCPVFPTNV